MHKFAFRTKETFNVLIAFARLFSFTIGGIVLLHLHEITHKRDLVMNQHEIKLAET